MGVFFVILDEELTPSDGDSYHCLLVPVRLKTHQKLMKNSNLISYIFLTNDYFYTENVKI